MWRAMISFRAAGLARTDRIIAQRHTLGPVFAAVFGVFLILVPGLTGTVVHAETTQDKPMTARLDALAAVMQIAPMLEVLRQEGLVYGRDLDSQMLGGAGGAAFAAKVGALYDTTAMRALYDATIATELGSDPALLREIEAFFATDLGRRVMVLELEARRALLNSSVEAAAQANVAALRARKDARLAILQQFAEVSDLIETNVTGGLNANLAFFQGLADGGGPAANMTEQDMLTEVWSQESAVRQETVDWLFPFLALAYQPLSDDEMRTYTAFCQSPAGQRLNAAVFAAFDAIFVTISRGLGQAVASDMHSEAL